MAEREEYAFGTLELEAPGHPARSGDAVVGYVRPHDLDLAREQNGASSLEAIVQHVHPAGPVVRLELRRTDTGDSIEAALTRERYRLLAPRVGERVYVETRNLRVFPDEPGRPTVESVERTLTTSGRP